MNALLQTIKKIVILLFYRTFKIDVQSHSVPDCGDTRSEV
jgi:hypothetical protein